MLPITVSDSSICIIIITFIIIVSNSQLHYYNYYHCWELDDEDKPLLGCVHTMSVGLGYQEPLTMFVHIKTISPCGDR